MPNEQPNLPLFGHDLAASSAFTAAALLEAVRAERNLPRDPVPEVCVLEFDGDLTDWLVATGRAKRWRSWACFHTSMETVEADGDSFGLIARTIGGPYAVLVAEQLAASGARVILQAELSGLGLPVVTGTVWTTDAPYRETAEQLERHARNGILAVEMQAASLFAFGAARRVKCGVVAQVTNGVDHSSADQFDRGTHQLGFEILKAMSRAGRRCLRDR